MPAPRKSVVTLKEVAARTGFGLATVSYALRNDPKIPRATRDLIHAAATALGYRPNPRVASLMAHIRGARNGVRGRVRGETIAFLWVHTTRQQAARDAYLQKVCAGARSRAEQAGFTLEEFSTDDPGMTPRRLERILRARGVVGVVLSPVTTNEATIALDWDWQPFAAAVIGNVSWRPELHHAGHHHFLGMRLALLELARLGCTRPVALIDQETNERAKRAWEAAFLVHHPRPAEAARNVQVRAMDQMHTVATWVRARRSDALIVSATELAHAPGMRTLIRQLGLKVVTLRWDESANGIGGIDQCHARIAAHAVDLVITQLNSNETGVPDLPRMMLFPGLWVAP